jgi:GDPmannose 4,6-dehydratase
VERAFGVLGIEIEWRGKGVEEVGVVGKVVDVVEVIEVVGGEDEKMGRGAKGEGLKAKGEEDAGKLKEGDVIVRVDPRYFRPTEVDTLLGDASKAKEKLGWEPEISFEEMVDEMVLEDLKLAQRDYMIKKAGFRAFDYNE